MVDAELQKLATELRAKFEKLQTKRVDDIQRAQSDRLALLNGDLLSIISGNGNIYGKFAIFFSYIGFCELYT